MKWSETQIAGALARQTFDRKYLVVVPNCNWTGHECDLLAVTPDLRIVDVEIKISRADLKADAKKDKWWHSQFIGLGERKEVFNDAGRLIRIEQPHLYDKTARVHPPKVWKHYYALPRALWDDALFEFLPSPASGVLLLDEGKPPHMAIRIDCVRRATPCKTADKISPAAAVDIARLASLRMWDAYQARDAANAELQRNREPVAA